MNYVTELSNVLRDSNVSQDDRQAVLNSLRNLADKGDTEARLALVSGNLEPVENSRSYLNFALDPFTIMAHFGARQQALYEKYKAEGLTAAECVARFRENNINGALHYSLIEVAAQACEKADRSALYRYHLVDVYHHLKSTPDYDWPGKELGEATLSKFLPYEWLSRELFEAMADMELRIKLNLGGNTLDQSLKSHPCVERVRETKAKFPGSYAWIPDCVNSVVYSVMVAS